MNKYNNFIFKDYDFDDSSKILRLYYSFDGILEFSEEYKFDFKFVDYDPVVLDRAIQTLFFMAGVSYFKAYLPQNIIIDKGQLNHEMANFFSKTYQKGLGEFFYVNKINPNFKINFPITEQSPTDVIPVYGRGLLVGIGGGKDSLVTIELLRNSGQELTTWSLGHRSQLEPLVKEIGLAHLWVDRKWDRLLLEHNANGALNGHIPISAILACVGTITAILSGKEAVVVSNENSANEADLVYDGISINHQYSKSIEFEKDYQNYLKATIKSPTYFSFLRPLSEIYIAEIFANIGFEKYKSVFSSCNRAFTHDSNHMFWCGECAKCAFTYLAFTPFIDKKVLESIWGKNLLLDPKLEHTYKNLLGISGDKPLDCVGEIKESRAAMRLAQKIYPELNKYNFDIPEEYNYQSLSDHSMPKQLAEILFAKIKT